MIGSAVNHNSFKPALTAPRQDNTLSFDVIRVDGEQMLVIAPLTALDGDFRTSNLNDCDLELVNGSGQRFCLPNLTLETGKALLKSDKVLVAEVDDAGVVIRGHHLPLDSVRMTRGNPLYAEWLRLIQCQPEASAPAPDLAPEMSA